MSTAEHERPSARLPHGGNVSHAHPKLANARHAQPPLRAAREVPSHPFKPAQAVEQENIPHVRLPLYSYFCDFYATLVDVKRKLLGVSPVLPNDQRPPELAPAAVHERLLEALRAQDNTVRLECTEEQRKVYRDALYAMAALADEQLLLDVKWPGSAQWLDFALESALFDMRLSGVRFYWLIDSLLAEPAPTPLHAELGLVLLGALGVGFRGELRGVDQAQKLAQRREQLVAFVRKVRGRRSGEPSDDRKHRHGSHSHGFEQAYEHTVGPTVPEPANCRLAPLSPWFNAARLALIAYLVGSGVLWYATIYPFSKRVSADRAAQLGRVQQCNECRSDTAGGRFSNETQASGRVVASTSSDGVAAATAATPGTTAPDGASSPNARARTQSPQGGVQ
jgi:type VI secretion system protein ImpK